MQLIDVIRCRPKKGEVGVEIEVEGNRLPNAPAGWCAKGDGSLRGNQGVEYVSYAPVMWKELEKHIKTLKIAFDGAVVDFTHRAATHIHVNVQRMTAEELFDKLVNYFIVESLLLKYSSDFRCDSVYAVAAHNESTVIDYLYQIKQQQSFKKLDVNRYKYNALNLVPIWSYGSVEFRAFTTPTDFMDILPWANLLKCVMDNTYKPIDMVEDTSRKGVDHVLHSVFGDMADLLKCPGYEDMVIDGVRRVQGIVYEVPSMSFRTKDPLYFEVPRPKDKLNEAIYRYRPIDPRNFEEVL